MQVIKRVGSFVVSKFRQVKTGVTGLMVAAVTGTMVLVGGSGAFAQGTPVEVDIAIPDIDYGGVATNVLAAVVPGLVAAIGLGLTIWAISFIYRKFKQMGR